MKKQFLSFGVGLFSVVIATAQDRTSTMFENETRMVLSPNTQAIKAENSVSTILSTTTITNHKNMSTARVTLGGSRWYNYVEYNSHLNNQIYQSQSLPYLWKNANVITYYSSGFDTLQIASYGTIFDPAFMSDIINGANGFNSPSIYPLDEIAVTRANDYTIDSVMVTGKYYRSLSRPSTVVDTLRIGVVYGKYGTNADLSSFRTWGDYPATTGEDTAKIVLPQYNTTTGVAQGSATLVMRDYYLDANTENDTTSTGWNMFGVPVNLNVPAGNVVGITATYISGDTYIPYVDTVFFGSTRPSDPYGRNMFRPAAYEERAGDLPLYYSGYYNLGIWRYPAFDNGSVLDGHYIGNFNIISGGNPAAYTPYIDVKVSCSTCGTIKDVGVDEVSVKVANIFPNPANTTISIPVTAAKGGEIEVALLNTLGQTVAVQNMGKFTPGQKQTAVFSTSHIPSGVYMYSVTANNGARATGRFVVSH
jgi:hypothetical protein